DILEDPVAARIFARGEAGRVGLVGGAEDGAAGGENAADIIEAQRPDAVLDEPEEPVLDAEDLGAGVDGILGGGPDHGVEPGTVAAAGEESDSWWHGGG